MNGFNTIFFGALLSAFLVLIFTLLPIWLEKKPIWESRDKIAVIIIIIFIITALYSFTQYSTPPLPSGIDNESINIKVAWNNEGLALYKLGNYTGAIKCYDKAIEIDQGYVLAWSNKGDALTALHRYAEAEIAFANARKAQGEK